MSEPRFHSDPNEALFLKINTTLKLLLRAIFQVSLLVVRIRWFNVCKSAHYEECNEVFKNIYLVKFNSKSRKLKK